MYKYGRSKFIAMLALFFVAMSLGTYSDAKEPRPFGVRMGMTLADLSKQIKISPFPEHINEYISTDAPDGSPEFVSYLYTISPSVGLCRVTAISEAGPEEEVVLMLMKIGRKLENMYGMAQKKGEKFVWRPASQSNIQAIILRADKSGGMAGIRLGYIFINFSTCGVASVQKL